MSLCVMYLTHISDDQKYLDFRFGSFRPIKKLYVVMSQSKNVLNGHGRKTYMDYTNIKFFTTRFVSTVGSKIPNALSASSACHLQISSVIYLFSQLIRIRPFHWKIPSYNAFVQSLPNVRELLVVLKIPLFTIIVYAHREYG